MRGSADARQGRSACLASAIRGRLLLPLLLPPCLLLELAKAARHLLRGARMLTWRGTLCCSARWKVAAVEAAVARRLPSRCRCSLQTRTQQRLRRGASTGVGNASSCQRMTPRAPVGAPATCSAPRSVSLTGGGRGRLPFLVPPCTDNHLAAKLVPSLRPTSPHSPLPRLACAFCAGELLEPRHHRHDARWQRWWPWPRCTTGPPGHAVWQPARHAQPG